MTKIYEASKEDNAFAACVIEQSLKLQEKLSPLLRGLMKGQFAAYFNGIMIIAPTHQDAYVSAIKLFDDSPFAIEEITDEMYRVSDKIKF